MTLAITPFYAGLLGLIFVALSWRVIAMRRSAGVSLGDGGNKALLRRQRAHGNFAEYAPITLILIAFAEIMGAWTWWVHALNLALLGGRSAHAWALSGPPNVPARVGGMSVTFGALILAAVTCMILAVI